MNADMRKEEIDLLDILVRLVRTIIQNLVWIIVFVAAGGTVAYFGDLKSNPPVWEARMLIRAHDITLEELDFLMLHYQRSQLPGLSTDEQKKHVEDFIFSIYKQSVPVGDTDGLMVFIRITAIVDDTTILRKVESALVKKMNEEPLIIEYQGLGLRRSKKMIEQYDKQIQLIESLIDKKNAVEVAPLLAELRSLRTKRTERELVLQRSAIELADNFKFTEVPHSIVRSVALGLVAGFVLSGLFIAIKSFVSYYRKVNSSTV
jgi:hypothetical protein